MVNRNPPVRGECQGWSFHSSRSNTRFLYSVISSKLPVSSIGKPLIGFAASFTIRDCPKSHSEWKRIREAFLVHQRRRGLYRLHWLTEWQARGCPHLHMALWFNIPTNDYQKETLAVRVMADWLYQTVALHSSEPAQDIKPITDELGWLKYLSKHASRGAAHYQRARAAVPAGWKKTGRMWGHLGDFPVREPVGIELDNPGWACFRRIVRGWRIAQARHVKPPELPDGRRIRLARGMLRCPDYGLSWVRGVSEWIPLDLSLDIVRWLQSCGYYVDQQTSG